MGYSMQYLTAKNNRQRKWKKKFKEKPGISYIQKYNYSLSLIVDTNLLLKQCWDITSHMERYTRMNEKNKVPPHL